MTGAVQGACEPGIPISHLPFMWTHCGPGLGVKKPLYHGNPTDLGFSNTLYFVVVT